MLRVGDAAIKPRSAAAPLRALERVVFEFAQPGTVVVTTPNAEYNTHFPALSGGKLRHRDHRFEWTRPQFSGWAQSLGERFQYAVRFLGIGSDDATTGPPTQMAVFTKNGMEVAP
jgi:hypothetical protein